MPAVHEPTSWGAGATAAPNDMVVLVLCGLFVSFRAALICGRLSL